MVYDSAVARVAEILYYCFELFVYSLNLMVGFVLKEHLNPIGRMF